MPACRTVPVSSMRPPLSNGSAARSPPLSNGSAAPPLSLTACPPRGPGPTGQPTAATPPPTASSSDSYRCVSVQAAAGTRGVSPDPGFPVPDPYGPVWSSGRPPIVRCGPVADPLWSGVVQWQTLYGPVWSSDRLPMVRCGPVTDSRWSGVVQWPTPYGPVWSNGRLPTVRCGP